MQTRQATTARPRVQRPMSATQRKTLATQGILNAISATDEKVALTAALEIVNERLVWDRELRQRLSEKYEELQALASTKAGTNRDRTPVPRVTPISGPDLDHYSPYGKLNPYKLLEGYGREQLRAVLKGATPTLLREAVDVVQERNPGTKPVSRSRKADMIDYITEHVAGPGY